MSSTIDRSALRRPASASLAGQAPTGRGKTPPGKPRAVAKKTWHKLMLWLRRIHLYSGLYMFPWVILYGLTGLFFNHPRSFTGATQTAFSLAGEDGAPFAEFPSPDAVADEVAQLNESIAASSPAAPGDEDRVIRTASSAPQYSSILQFTVSTDEVDHAIAVNPLTGRGTIQTRDVEPDEDSPASKPLLPGVRSVSVDSNPLENVRAAIPAVLESLGLASGDAVAGRRTPSLRFSAQVDGRPGFVVYNLGNGFVSASAAGDQTEFSTKSFMQRLHLSRGYAPGWGSRTLWALSVDAMAVSMVFWGVSGVLMWWQLKKTRWWGAAALFASTVSAALLVVGMHEQLTASGRRGGPPGRRPAATQGAAGLQRLDAAAPSATRGGDSLDETGGERRRRGLGGRRGGARPPRGEAAEASGDPASD